VPMRRARSTAGLFQAVGVKAGVPPAGPAPVAEEVPV
jgi:hypothetical protein